MQYGPGRNSVISMDAYCFECSCSVSDIRVPIRAKSAPSRTEAMFPFPMSIAVLRAKTPQKKEINTGFRDAQVDCDAKVLTIQFYFVSDRHSKMCNFHYVLLRQRSGSTGRGCPRASSTPPAVPGQTSRRRSRRSPSSSRGTYACAAA